MAADGMQRVFRALANPVRREILDLLRRSPRTTGETCAAFPRLSRFAVMKHLAVLAAARLVLVRREGRTRVNALNVVPLQRLHERWMRPYESATASGLLALARRAEAAAEPAVGERSPAPRAPSPERARPAPEVPRSRARSLGTFPRSPKTRRKESPR